MKLKKPLLLTVLLLLLMQMSYSQTPPESRTGPGNEYGIEPEKLYPGSAILEILAAVDEEVDAAVGEAYAEGYKAASLRYAPEIESLKMQVSILPQQKAGVIKNHFLFGISGFVLGALAVGIYNLAR
jgi:hypothetical protein